jgi:glycosyltransferase involved in cell wall biosynthesis
MSSLVSVIITTFNSSLFVVETLESVFKQTWKAIELIITDDCSNDDTIQVCQKWIKEKGQRFIHIEILTTEQNTGVSANANRGLKASKGVWIKFLGADDTLNPDCLEDNMLWIDSHPEIKVLFSCIKVYKDTFEPLNELETFPGDPYNHKSILVEGLSASSQYRILLLSDRIHFSPSVFLHRQTLIDIGGFDERFRLLEDYPLWLNLTRNGHLLCFMDKVSVNYRRHSKAINNTGIGNLINPNYFRTEDFRKIYTYPNLPADVRLYQRYNWYVSQIFRVKCLNTNKKTNRFILVLLTSYLNPFKYFIWLRKRMNKSLKNNEFYM